MELSYEEAKKILNEKIAEIPEISAVVAQDDFQAKISRILLDEHVDEKFLPEIEWELKCVLARYAPIDELAENISESTGLTEDQSEDIALSIEAKLLRDLTDSLYAYAYHWHQTVGDFMPLPDADGTLKEKLELRPQGVPLVRENSGGEAPSIPTPPPANADLTVLGNIGQKPLTREAILGSLTHARTMANDIASLKESDGKVHGYEAYVAEREQKNTETKT